MSVSADRSHATTREVRRLVALGGPAALTQVGAMLLGVVDTIMVGRLGVHDLDAASLGNVWLMGSLILGMGLMFGLDPILAPAHGARDGERVGVTLQQGLVMAVLGSVPIALAWLFTAPALSLLGQSPALAATAHDYVLVQIPSIPPFLAFLALRQYLQCRGVVMPALWITVLANGFNAFANWVLIFGHLGFPELGLVGAGIATAMTRVFMLVGLVAVTLLARLHEGAWVPWSRRALHGSDLGRIARFGLPVAVQYGLETWAFQMSTLIAGRLGEKQLAAHTIVLNLASLAFMMPLGLSIGAAVRVGNLIGAGERERAQHAAHVALGLGAAVMLLSATAFVGLRWILPTLYTGDTAVIAVAASILPIAAAFQLFDGVQAVGGGILRGMGNTVPAAVFNLVGYYALALPLAVWLTFPLALGLTGIWWGLALGLALVATSLVVWVVRRGPARQARRKGAA
jgi:MATE family multidrug resistance protein